MKRTAFLLGLTSSLALSDTSARLHGSADPRFALAGSGGRAFSAKLGLSYYVLEGNYSSDMGRMFSSVNPANDPSRGFHVVRKVAKLNVRTDSLGESNAQFQSKLVRYAEDLAAWYPLKWSKKPEFKWFSPKADSLIAAESLQIVQTIRREKNRAPPITGTVWEIGNEPNLFPAITPAEYASIFDRYYRVIKSEDPSAQVALGPIFMPETAEDLKIKLQEVSEKIGNDLQVKLEKQVKASGLFSLVNSDGFFPYIIADIKATLMSRMLAESTPDYIKHVLEATSFRPDLVTLHVYPYDDRPPYFDAADLNRLVNSAMEKLTTLLADENVPATYWITEFGNLNQGYSAERVASQTHDLINTFKANPRIVRWFYYKSVGSDEQLAIIASGSPPLTRLATDADFSPLDGNFACARMNAIGQAYYQESHGRTCTEYVGFASRSSARTSTGPGLPIRVRLDSPSDRTITVRYAIQNDPERGYVQASGILSFAPGETEKSLPQDAGRGPDYAPGDSIRWVLQGVDGASLAGDSLHTEVILPGDNAPPVIDSIWADKYGLFKGDSLTVRVSAEDAEGDALSFLWTGRAGNVLGDKAALAFHTDNLTNGKDTLWVQVSDGRGGSATGSFEYHIMPNLALRRTKQGELNAGPGSTLNNHRLKSVG